MYSMGPFVSSAPDGVAMEIDLKKAIATYLKDVAEWSKETELATPDADLNLEGPGEEDDVSDEED